MFVVMCKYPIIIRLPTPVFSGRMDVSQESPKACYVLPARQSRNPVQSALRNVELPELERSNVTARLRDEVLKRRIRECDNDITDVVDRWRKKLSGRSCGSFAGQVPSPQGGAGWLWSSSAWRQ